jgi:BirA family biotin operon repressor/biotin-[acetyl-CoA-carboxylase] ligase
MKVQEQLLSQLANGELHSGSELAANLGITRSAVWKHIKQLDLLEIEVEAQAGQGYRLKDPLELLDQDQILAALSEHARELCGTPDLRWVAESTSNALLDQPPPQPGQARVCLAEYQSSGRGRRGRQWHAPAGHAICLSVSWCFPVSPPDFSCLGLAIGVAVMRALGRAGATEVQLKWPNDVVINGNKLAGILIDVQGEASGPLHVVAGVGVNYRLSHRTEQAVKSDGGRQPASLVDNAGDALAGRNATSAFLIEEIITNLADFGRQGFGPLAAEWNAADSLSGQQLDVVSDSGTLTGIAKGITDDGRLKLDTGDKIHLLVTGDVSLRKDA